MGRPEHLGLELPAVFDVDEPAARASIHSPALTLGSGPPAVSGSRWPRTLTRSTQKPVSAL
jgi:hypothetical protein